MTMAMSPRISFSHDVDLSIDSHHPLDNSILPNDDFDFIVNSNIYNIQDPSPADELFSQGKLLPLSSVIINPATATTRPSVPPRSSPKKNQLKDLILSSTSSPKPHPANNSKSPFWSMGRSISVGPSRNSSSSSSRSSYFARSKSTGSYQSQNQKGKSNCYYYAASGKRSGSCGNGVWINPVTNVPAPFMSRGGSGGSSSSSTNGSSGSGHNGAGNSNFFAYLLCHCRGKNSEVIEAGYPS